VLLFFAVPTLSTLAKNSWYLPQSNPGHYLNIASKMQMPHCPAVFENKLLDAVARFVPLQPLTRRTRESEPQPVVSSIAVAVSLQHRSPPFIFA